MTEIIEDNGNSFEVEPGIAELLEFAGAIVRDNDDGMRWHPAPGRILAEVRFIAWLLSEGQE